MRGYFLSIRGFLLVGAALLALLLAGCGGSDDSATGSSGGEVTVETGSLSKAEFTKQATALCKKTQEQFEGEAGALITRTSKNPPKPSETPPEITLVEESFVPIYQQQIEDLAALGAPQGDEEALTALLKALQDVVDGASDDPRAFVESEASFGEAAKLAKAYGIPACGEL